MAIPKSITLGSIRKKNPDVKGIQKNPQNLESKVEKKGEKPQNSDSPQDQQALRSSEKPVYKFSLLDWAAPYYGFWNYVKRQTGYDHNNEGRSVVLMLHHLFTWPAIPLVYIARNEISRDISNALANAPEACQKAFEYIVTIGL